MMPRSKIIQQSSTNAQSWAMHCSTCNHQRNKQCILLRIKDQHTIDPQRRETMWMKLSQLKPCESNSPSWLGCKTKSGEQKAKTSRTADMKLSWRFKIVWTTNSIPGKSNTGSLKSLSKHKTQLDSSQSTSLNLILGVAYHSRRLAFKSL